MHTLKMLSGLLLSVGAFTALGVGFAMTAEATPQAAIEREPAAEVAIDPVEQPPAAVEPAEQTVNVEPAAEPEPTGIEVPEMTGRTALRALRAAREAGLVADIRDEDGDPVAPAERRYMSVVEQGADAGSHVEEGSTVRLVARYPRAGFASGY